MAHLVRPSKTYYADAAGRRVPKGTAGAKKVRVKATKWYGQGIPGLPPKKRVPLSSDKAAARRLLDDLVRRGEQGNAGLPDREAQRKSLADHLTAFEQDVALGLASKSGRRRSPAPEQVQAVVQRVRAVLDGAGLTHTTDLNPAAPAKVAKYLQGRAAKTLKQGGFSAQSAVFHLAAIRRFVRWLSKKAAVPADLLDGVPGFDPKADRVHARREVGPDELARVLDAANTSPTDFRGLFGPDRYHLYLVAFSTGYRAGELAELCPENFALDADPPLVSLPARLTKNEKAAR